MSRIKLEYKILEFKEIDSTNVYIKKNIELLKNSETLIIVKSEHQTAGCGRNGHNWYSPDGGLWFSFAFTIDEKNLNTISSLSQIISLSICKILETDFTLTPKIKWPNDILIEYKKLGGILLETVKYLDKRIIIIGIGLNTNFNSNDLKGLVLNLKPVSTLDLLNKKINNKELMNKIIKQVLLNYEIFLEKGYKFFKEEIIKRDCLFNSKIKIKSDAMTFDALVKGFTDEGFLIVVDNEFNTKIIYSGEVEYYSPTCSSVSYQSAIDLTLNL